MDLKKLEMMNTIRQNSEDTTNIFEELVQWEQEMKAKDKQKFEKQFSNKSEEIPQIRSHISDKTKEPLSDDKDSLSLIKVISTDDCSGQKDIQAKANEYKELGNNYFKLKEYDKSIGYYNKAIDIYDKEPVYYANRAFSYLKIKRYAECVTDASQAIQLSSMCVKAFYRRGLAYEELKKYAFASKDFRKVLSIEPKNSEAQQSLFRVSKKLEQTKDARIINKSKPWSQIGENVEEIDFIKKEQHVQSDHPLKRIQITDIMNLNEKRDKDAYNRNTISAQNDKSDDIPNYVVDAIFNNSTGFIPPVPRESLLLPSNDFARKQTKHTKNYISEASPTGKNLISPIIRDDSLSKQQTNKIINTENAKNAIPALPNNHGEFESTWKELSELQRYEYLKIINPSLFQKVLGSSLNSNILSELLQTLTLFTENSIPIIEYLKIIASNSQMKILSMFLTGDDQSVLDKLISYMENTEETNKQNIESLLKSFNRSV